MYSDCSDSDQIHEFQRELDRKDKKCEVCNDLWPSADGVKAKYHKCIQCGLLSHGSCRTVAQKYFPCDDSKALLKHNHIFHSHLSNDSIFTGAISIQFLQLYDIPLQPGVSIYGKCQINKNPTLSITSSTVQINNQREAIWDDIGSNTLLSYNLSSNSIIHTHLEIEIWKSFISIFDNILCVCNVNISPLLQLPGIEIERWFGLRTIDGRSYGNILLRMTCIPKVMDINQDINESIDSNEESSDGDGNSPDGDTKDISKKAIDLNENEDIRDEDLDSIKQSTDVSSKSSSPPFDKLPTSSNLTNKTIDPINISSFRNNINTPISLNDDSDFLDANDIDIETFDKNKSKNSDINSLNNSFDNNLPLDKYNISLSEDSDYDDEESDESSDSKISTDRKKSNSSINILSSSLTNNLSTFLSTPIASPMIRSRNNSNVGQLSSQEAPGLFSDLDFFKQFTTTNNTTTLPGNNAMNENKTFTSDWSNYATNLTNTMLDSIGINKSNQSNSTTNTKISKQQLQDDAIGYVHIDLISAFKSEATDILTGNYYVLITLDKLHSHSTIIEYKTKVVNNSATPIFNYKIKIPILHYRNVINLYLIDVSNTIERKIGVTTISIYQLIQNESDNYFNAINKSNDSLSTNKYFIKDLTDKSKSIGYYILNIKFIEDINKLYLNYDPKCVTNSPAETISMERLTIHIARFQELYDLIIYLINEYFKIILWDDVVLTLIYLVVFVYICLFMNSEYFLCIPLCSTILVLSSYLLKRISKQYKLQFIQVKKKENKSLTPKYQSYGIIQLSIIGFKSNKSNYNINKYIMKIYYKPSNYLSLVDAMTYLDSIIQNKSSKLDQNLVVESKEVYVGTLSNSYLGGRDSKNHVYKLISSLNISNIIGSSDNITYPSNDRSIIQNIFSPWPLKKDFSSSTLDNFYIMKDISVLYPILQPIDIDALGITKVNRKSSIDNNNFIYDESNNIIGTVDPASANDLSNNLSASNTTSSQYNNITTKITKGSISFIPWNDNNSFIKVLIYSDEITTQNDTPIGFIRVPIVDMVDSAHPKGLQQELYKWYDVYKFKSSKNSTQGVLDDDSKSDKSSKIDSTINTSKDEYLNSNELIGLQIYLRLQLDIRDTDKSSDREVSTSLQQIFFNQPKDETKSNTSTISTLWNMVDHITYVQNLMSWLLDIIESFKNIFNWTNPSKTYPIYLFFIAFWIVSIMIPSRYIILTIGLHQFFYKFLPDPDGKQMSVRFYNLLQSLPNDDDLSQIYSEDKKLHLDNIKTSKHHQKRNINLNIVIPSLWDGVVHMKLSTVLSNQTVSNNSINLSNSNNNHSNEWIELYLSLQGTRLVWWQNENDIRDNKPCLGQLLLLQPTASITQASPVDIKEMKDKDSSMKLISVFGCNENGYPLKCTILFSNGQSCQSFQNKVKSILQY